MHKPLAPYPIGVAAEVRKEEELAALQRAMSEVGAKLQMLEAEHAGLEEQRATLEEQRAALAVEKDEALGALEAMQREKDASVAEVARLQHQYGETTEKHKMSEEELKRGSSVYSAAQMQHIADE